jgi:hypothetical protein
MVYGEPSTYFALVATGKDSIGGEDDKDEVTESMESDSHCSRLR